ERDRYFRNRDRQRAPPHQGPARPRRVPRLPPRRPPSGERAERFHRADLGPDRGGGGAAIEMTHARLISVEDYLSGGLARVAPSMLPPPPARCRWSARFAAAAPPQPRSRRTGTIPVETSWDLHASSRRVVVPPGRARRRPRSLRNSRALISSYTAAAGGRD